MVLKHWSAPRLIPMFGVILLGWLVVAPAASQAPPGQAPPSAGRGRGAPAPATRIVTFEAQPATIKPGQSALLVWHIENPPSATGFNAFGTIEPGVGNVAPRGSRRVTPTATTTYTLAAGSVTKTVTVTIPGTKPVTAAAGASARAIQRSVARRMASRTSPASSGGGTCSVVGAAAAPHHPRSSQAPRSTAWAVAHRTRERRPTACR